MTRNTNRARPGVTLIEVLAAIFILGVGMLAVLVLYPLGALKMAKALQDSRAGTIAQNADAISLMFDLRNDANVTAVLASGYAPPGGPPPGYAPSEASSFSYPVFVDPYYSTTYPTLGTPAVGRIAATSIPATAAERWCSFLDDHTFQSNGSFVTPAGPINLQRQWRYTWSWMFKRVRSSDPQTTECWVVVYSGRPITVPIPEEPYTVAAPETTAVGGTSVVLKWAIRDPNGVGVPIQEKPPLRRGHWLFDATYKTRNRGAAANGYVHAEFYKVTEAVEEPGYTDPATNITYAQLRVEIQPPLRDAFVQTMVTLPGAVEVFERGNGRR